MACYFIINGQCSRGIPWTPQTTAFETIFFKSESNLLQGFFDVRQSNSGKHPFLNAVMLNIHKQMI